MRFSRKSLGIPYAVFLVIFVAAPLLFLFYYAFTNGQGQFTIQNFTHFFTDPNTLGTLYYSFSIALVTTLVCLLLAYPAAYFLATSTLRSKSVILMLFIMPMWINFSLRITALKEILNVIEGNLAMHPFLNAVVGMTYDFMPFMILPIYTTISRLDGALREAAMDLGASRGRAFLDITLPMIAPAIATGMLLSFAMSIDDVVISVFVTGVGINTLPLKIYTSLKVGVTPKINALCTLMFLATLAIVLLIQLSQHRGGRRGDNDKNNE